MRSGECLPASVPILQFDFDLPGSKSYSELCSVTGFFFPNTLRRSISRFMLHTPFACTAWELGVGFGITFVMIHDTWACNLGIWGTRFKANVESRVEAICTRDCGLVLSVRPVDLLVPSDSTECQEISWWWCLPLLFPLSTGKGRVSTTSPVGLPINSTAENSFRYYFPPPPPKKCCAMLL